MQEFVVIHERSAGNESIGSMWEETAIFPETATLAEVAAWADRRAARPNDKNLGGDGRVMIQTAQRPASQGVEQ